MPFGQEARKRSVVAAVADDDERENGEPDPVIVKQVAQAVVHNRYATSLKWRYMPSGVGLL